MVTADFLRSIAWLLAVWLAVGDVIILAVILL